MYLSPPFKRAAVHTNVDLSLLFQHMVQNQMTPSYPQFPPTSIEEYQQAAAAAATVATTAAISTDPTAQQTYKDAQQAYVQAPVTQNGVEQQTVSFWLPLLRCPRAQAR